MQSSIDLRWIVTCLTLLLFGCGGGGSSQNTASSQFSVGKNITVPNVAGFTEADAETAFASAGMFVQSKKQDFSTTVPAGNVISQYPPAGTSVTLGSGVNLVMSKGPAISVPDVTGLPETNAQNAITAVGLVIGTIAQDNSRTVPTGSVITQSPAAGTAVAQDTPVNIVVSSPFAAIFATMSSNRIYHAAATLSNGLALLTGGYEVSGNTANTVYTAETYDPASHSFTPLSATMTSARRRHTATLLADGRVLLTGGIDAADNILDTAELYDPAANTFTALGSTMVSARFSHTATLLSNGQVLLTGGIGSGKYPLNTAELYDPTANTFTAVAPTMIYARAYHAAALLPGGQVLLTGGSSDNKSGLDSAELYDPSANTFTGLSSTMTSVRAWHTATRLPNGQVLLAGGFDNSNTLNTAELYDPVANIFTALTPTMISTRAGHAATLLANGMVLLTGGANGSHVVLDTAEVYDPLNK